MKSRRLRILVGSLAVLALAGAPNTYDEGKAVALLKRDLEPYLHTLSRDVYVYNWSYAPKTGVTSNDPQDPRGLKYIRERTEALFSEGSWEGAATGGFYVASDPVASQSYGGKEAPALVQFRLKSGASFIDLGGFRFQTETYGALAWAGCPTNSYQSEFSDYFIQKTNLRKSCKRLFERAFHELKVVGFRYGYSGFPLEGCDGEHQRAGALVLGNEAFDLGEWNLFTKSLPSKNLHELEVIQSVYESRIFRSEYWSTPFFGTKALENGGERAARYLQRGRVDARERIADHLLGCSPLKYPEDQWRNWEAENPQSLLDRITTLAQSVNGLSATWKLPIDYRHQAVPKALFPLTPASLAQFARELSPHYRFIDENFRPEKNPTPKPTPTSNDCARPEDHPLSTRETNLVEACRKIAPSLLPDLDRALAGVNVFAEGKGGYSLTMLATSIQSLMRLKPFESGNSEVASALLQAALASRGFPATYRLVWDDELSHHPDALAVKLREEVLRRTYNAEVCLRKYEAATSERAVRKILASPDCAPRAEP